MTWLLLLSHTMQLAGRACSRSTARQAVMFAPASHGSPRQDARRRISTAAHFYQNRHLEVYASKPATRLTLRQLVRARMYLTETWNGSCVQVFFGKSMNEERLIKVRVFQSRRFTCPQAHFCSLPPSRVRTMSAQSCLSA